MLCLKQHHHFLCNKNRSYIINSHNDWGLDFHSHLIDKLHFFATSAISTTYSGSLELGESPTSFLLTSNGLVLGPLYKSQNLQCSLESLYLWQNCCCCRQPLSTNHFHPRRIDCSLLYCYFDPHRHLEFSWTWFPFVGVGKDRKVVDCEWEFVVWQWILHDIRQVPGATQMNSEFSVCLKIKHKMVLLVVSPRPLQE